MECLPSAKFTYNNLQHTVTQQMPFYLTMGFHPKATPYAPTASLVLTASQRFTLLQQGHEEAQAAYRCAHDRMCSWTPPIQKYQKGDKVWLEAMNITAHDLPKKLALRCYGPFTITEVLSSVAYWIQLLHSWKVHDVFYASLLSLVIMDALHLEEIRPPPDLIDKQIEWEIECILGSKIIQKQLY